MKLDMKCPTCQQPIPWLDSFRGIRCAGCGAAVRNEIARWVVWSLLVDGAVVAAYLSGIGFWGGAMAVLVVGVVLWFVLDCRLDPVVKRFPALRKYID